MTCFYDTPEAQKMTEVNVCLQYWATVTVFCQSLNSLVGFGKTPCISCSGYKSLRTGSWHVFLRKLCSSQLTCESHLWSTSLHRVKYQQKIMRFAVLVRTCAAYASVYFPLCCLAAHMIVTLCIFGRYRLASKCLLIVLDDSSLQTAVRGSGKTDSTSGPGIVSGHPLNRLFLSPLLFSTVWTKGCWSDPWWHHAAWRPV